MWHKHVFNTVAHYIRLYVCLYPGYPCNKAQSIYPAGGVAAASFRGITTRYEMRAAGLSIIPSHIHVYYADKDFCLVDA